MKIQDEEELDQAQKKNKIVRDLEIKVGIKRDDKTV